MTQPLPSLHSNGQTLPNTPDRLGWLEPTDASLPVARQRERLLKHGYLWLKGFLPRQEVLGFRRHFFTAFEDTGLLRAGSDPETAIYAGSENAELCSRRLSEVVRSAAFESFCLQKRLWTHLDGMLDGPSYLHKRKIIRYTKPGELSSTPAHYDLIYLRGGTDRVVTTWIPIGDVPVQMGGLIYLEGSDQLGRQMEVAFSLQNAELSPAERISAYNKNMSEGGWVSKDLPEMAQKFSSRWLAADYEAGDILLHSPYMIHAATANEDPAGRIRLSTDIRFQNVRDEIDARWSNHWSLNDML